jgi:hypothetical protein
MKKNEFKKQCEKIVEFLEVPYSRKFYLFPFEKATGQSDSDSLVATKIGIAN